MPVIVQQMMRKSDKVKSGRPDASDREDNIEIDLLTNAIWRYYQTDKIMYQ